MPHETEEFTTELQKVSRSLVNRPSVVDNVEHFLREMITRGNLKLGQRIVETRIARQLGIGQPAVREALKTLEAEGLVVRHPNRGCTVVEISPTEINQILRLRIEWEALAVELALEDWDDAKARKLRAAVERLKRAAQSGDVIEYYRYDLEFHKTLWQLSDNPFLERALSQITIPLFAFAAISRSARKEFDPKVDAKEHEKVALAVLSGDKGRAVETVRRELEKFRETGLRLLAAAED
jgi:DNA-binding GntR family transcriptional regulator